MADAGFHIARVVMIQQVIQPVRVMLPLHMEGGLLAGGVTQESARAFAGFVSGRVPTQSNVRGSAQYRTQLVRVLTERAALELAEVE